MSVQEKPKRFKPTPMSVALSLPGTDKKVEFQTVLSPKSIDGDVATVVGHILDENGCIEGEFEYEGFPVSSLNQIRPAGRKTDDKKRLSVFLDWVLKTSQGMGRIKADEEVASKFHYAAPKQIRDIRAGVCKEFSLDSESLNLYSFLNHENGKILPPTYAGIFRIKERKPTEEAGVFLHLAGIWYGNEKKSGKAELKFTIPDGKEAKGILALENQYIVLIFNSLEKGGRIISR